MTAVLDEATLEIRVTKAPGHLAGWLARAGAFVVDVVLGLALVVLMGVLQAASPQYGVPWWCYVTVAVVAFVGIAVNRVVLPALRGWSLGRALFGIAVVHRDGDDVGMVRLALRDLAHLVDTAAILIGWFWPLWDARNRTFADLLARTEVRRVRVNVGVPRPDSKRNAFVAMAAVAVVSAAGVGLNYYAVYRHENAVESTRAQIAADGPAIIEQILSFNADTRAQDFASAQMSVTDAYRPQLVAEQLSAATQEPFTNEFWTVNSAVLSASLDEASMLLMMQGRRATTDEDAKFVTATVRASFEKGADGAWRVSDLAVLTKPRPEFEEAPK